MWLHSVVVSVSAFHAEGPGFHSGEPRTLPWVDAVIVGERGGGVGGTLQRPSSHGEMATSLSQEWKGAGRLKVGKNPKPCEFRKALGAIAS